MTIRHNAELAVVSGPCRGIRFPFTMDAMKIGRDRSCEIHLDDEAASRAHSEVSIHGDGFILRDLKSTNGTYHNDARITEVVLQNGDRIGIGDSVLQIQIRQRPNKFAPQIVFSQDDRPPAVDRSLSLNDTHFLDATEGSSARDIQRRFAALFEFNAEIAGILYPPALLERALNRLFETFPAERGVILLMSAEGVPGMQIARVREGVEMEGHIDISRAMLQILLQKKESFLSLNPNVDMSRHVEPTSIIGVPLKVKDRVGGIVYLDTTNPARPFSEENLTLCTAMTMHLALCLENAQLYFELQSTGEFTHSVLRALGSGIMVVDFQERVLHVNRAALDIVDKTESQMIGHELREFTELAEFQQVVTHTIASKKPEDRYELHLKTANGTSTLGMSTSLLTDPHGGVSGVVITFRNLGALRKLEEQVRRAHHLDALGQMAAGVAHEIRNPLNSIRGFTQLVLEHEQTSPVSKEYTQIILEEVDRMNNIVQDMLDFSRQRPLTLLPLSLIKLLIDLVRDMQVDSKQLKVALEILEPGEELPNALGNRDKLRQVFRNIILNALQSCKSGGIVTVGFQRVVSQIVDPKTKSIDKTVAVREIVVHINDTGCGMAHEVLRKIFDPFFTQKETGTGLGLSISQKIIEQHHGRIEVKSEIGIGSTFSIHFPAIKKAE